MTLTSGTVIDRITRVGDVGEPGYSAYGQSLRKCTYSGSKDDWHGATQGSLSELLPTCYITESVYSYLTKAEIESVKNRIQGIVPNDYAYRHSVCPDYGRCYRCWEFKDGITARPLQPPCTPGDKDNINCPDGTIVTARECTYQHVWLDHESDCTECHANPEEGVYPSRYRICEDGSKISTHQCIDGMWVPTGMRCPEHDDEPDTGEPSGDIPNGDDDIPPGDEYQPKSEIATDLSSIFGDIKPTYIILAVIGIIILGFLT